MRASVSDTPPVGTGTTIVTGRDGYVWARAIETAPRATANAKAICNGFIVGRLPLQIEQGDSLTPNFYLCCTGAE